MIRVRWHDGVVTRAETWEALTCRIKRMPWNNPVKDARDMRNELAFRAYVWSGELVDPALPAEEFWRELEDTGLLTIEEGT